MSRGEGKNSEWSFGGVSADVAIKGFGGAVLLSGSPHKTMNLLTDVMGMEKVGEEGEYVRFKTSSDLGNIIDVKTTAQPRGMMGTGTVHHIAWRASDYEDHEQWRNHVGNNGYEVTPIIDRQYFNAVYFRESGGILLKLRLILPDLRAMSQKMLWEKSASPAVA